MWATIGRFVLRYKYILLIVLAALTAVSAYWAMQVGLSYEFGKAIPTNDPVNITYQEFKKKYGEDGNMIVIGVQSENFFKQPFFADYITLQKNLKNVKGVEDIISVPGAINLSKNYETQKLRVQKLFKDTLLTQAAIDSGARLFETLPFYKGLIYNAQTKAYIMGLRMNSNIINSIQRNEAIDDIKKLVDDFGKSHNTDVKLSGLPYIRTVMASRIANEMRYFLIASIVLSAIILLLFFRSFGSMLLSLMVVIIGVLFSLATMYLYGYSITLLTALIPPLIVVIGIPNCIYFLNKYHTSWEKLKEDPLNENTPVKQLKDRAIVDMVSRMGVVTLFCNVAAAIGFAVFALTKSAILKEFGIVSGINIMLLFLISLILIPGVLSMMPAPKAKHTKYLNNPRLNRWLDRLERWTLNHRKTVYTITVIIVAVAVLGTFRLNSNAYMVDDIPQTDKIYTDLKFFEKNLKGVMPLEIVVDTKKKYGVTRNFNNLAKLDSLTTFLENMPEVGKPLSIIGGLKFAKQAFYEGDSANYTMPSEFELPGLSDYLNMSGKDSTGKETSFSKIVAGFMDSTKREARLSMNMADIGTKKLPHVLDTIQQKINEIFPKDKYDVKLTGSSITFQKGSSFIIDGLTESIFWAFLLITLCMFYLFRSFRILLCSLIPNVIPLIITAGIMGWAGVPLKPSTVLIFSVALGIAIDITIRFLVNYKQELPLFNNNVKDTVTQTIHSTGISIIYTSLVLIAGFIIFCFSGFGGTKALGWLTSVTLVVATITNLVLLPALLISLSKKKKTA